MSSQLELLISAESIAAKTAELAARIRKDYGDRRIILVGILKGSFIFLSDLARAIGGDLEIDFAQTSSYASGKSSSLPLSMSHTFCATWSDQPRIVATTSRLPATNRTMG